MKFSFLDVIGSLLIGFAIGGLFVQNQANTILAEHNLKFHPRTNDFHFGSINRSNDLWRESRGTWSMPTLSNNAATVSF